MKHYCITGGIGAGKSYVCRFMAERGIDVYDCDSAAKRLMNESGELRKRLTALIGDDAYVDGCINKPVIARYLLESEENKQSINSIVHPMVIQDFYDSGYQWMECAILYDANLEKYVDRVVAVTAPKDVRARRVMKRDGRTYDEAVEWIDKQIPQELLECRADYVIVNDGVCTLENQIEEVIKNIQK